MLNSGKKFRAWRDKKNNIITLVLSEKKILNETKNHNTPFKLNGRFLIDEMFLFPFISLLGMFFSSDSKSFILNVFHRMLTLFPS